MRYVSTFFAVFFASALLCSCTGGGGAPGADAKIDTKLAIAQIKVVNSSCYYAALPGAFRMYCPGPKAEGSCDAIPSGLQVSYDKSDGTSAKANARGVTASENTAMPDTCMAFDLDLLPNATNKLSYKIGTEEFHIYSYLAYGDGTSIP